MGARLSHVFCGGFAPIPPPDKGTPLEFAACRVCAFFVALTPSPSPTQWERGATRQRFWSAEASASATCGSSASALHIPLSRRAREGDTGGEGKRACLPCCNCARKNRARSRDSVPNGCTLISSCRFPPLRGGNQAHWFPLRAGGTLRRGSSISLVFANFAYAIGKCLCVGFSICPFLTSPVDGGRNRGSLPARRDGWGGGYV